MDKKPNVVEVYILGDPAERNKTTSRPPRKQQLGKISKPIQLINGRANVKLLPQPKELETPTKTREIGVQVSVLSYKQEEKIRQFQLENVRFSSENTRMEQYLKKQKEKYAKLKSTVVSDEFAQLERIKLYAKSGNPKAVFLLDQIKNYEKKHNNWSEISLKQCAKWQLISVAGYTHLRMQNVITCPSRTTLDKIDTEGKSVATVQIQEKTAPGCVSLEVDEDSE